MKFLIKENMYFIILSMVIIFFFFYLRIDFTNNIYNIDELIPVKVSEMMSLTHTINTNWIYAELPNYFKYNQYNFSSYILTNHLLYNLIGFRFERLEFFKIINLFYQFVALLFYVMLLKKLEINKFLILIFSTLFTFSVLLVQDAHYARPESFLLMIVSIIIYLSYKLYISKEKEMYFFFGLVVLIFGFSLATKISMIPFIGLILYVVFKKKIFTVKILLIFTLITILGFIMGVPYIIFDFTEFIEGVTYLSNQYTHVHPPHSHIYYSFLTQFFWIFKYFLFTHGPIILLFPISILFILYRISKNSKIDREKMIFILFLSIISLFYILYFSTKQVFFERNFSHIIPIIFISIIYLINVFIFRLSKIKTMLLYLGLLVSLSISIYFSILVVKNIQTITSNSSDRKISEQYQLPIVLIDFTEILSNQTFLNYTSKFGILKVINYNDEFSEKYMNNLEKLGYKLIFVQKSDFWIIPTCTLHTYHAPSYFYFIPNNNNLGFVNSINIFKTNMIENGTFDKKSLVGLKIYGSFINDNSDKAYIQFQATKDEQILVKTGPISKNQIIKIIGNKGELLTENSLENSENWNIYKFPQNLPESFIVEISDNGSNWGEWSAVAFKKDNNDIK